MCLFHVLCNGKLYLFLYLSVMRIFFLEIDESYYILHAVILMLLSLSRSPMDLAQQHVWSSPHTFFFLFQKKNIKPWYFHLHLNLSMNQIYSNWIEDIVVSRQLFACVMYHTYHTVIVIYAVLSLQKLKVVAWWRATLM